MKYYNPETSFKTGTNCVYTLRQTGYDKGEPIMVNDVFISIHGNHLSPAALIEIRDRIAIALNNKYNNEMEGA